MLNLKTMENVILENVIHNLSQNKNTNVNIMFHLLMRKCLSIRFLPFDELPQIFYQHEALTMVELILLALPNVLCFLVLFLRPFPLHRRYVLHYVLLPPPHLKQPRLSEMGGPPSNTIKLTSVWWVRFSTSLPRSSKSCRFCRSLNFLSSSATSARLRFRSAWSRSWSAVLLPGRKLGEDWCRFDSR